MSGRLVPVVLAPTLGAVMGAALAGDQGLSFGQTVWANALGGAVGGVTAGLVLIFMTVFLPWVFWYRRPFRIKYPLRSGATTPRGAYSYKRFEPFQTARVGEQKDIDVLLTVRRGISVDRLAFRLGSWHVDPYRDESGFPHLMKYENAPVSVVKITRIRDRQIERNRHLLGTTTTESDYQEEGRDVFYNPQPRRFTPGVWEWFVVTIEAHEPWVGELSFDSTSGSTLGRTFASLPFFVVPAKHSRMVAEQKAEYKT